MDKEMMNEATDNIKKGDRRKQEQAQKASTVERSEKSEEACATSSSQEGVESGLGQPSDRVRAAFASAIESLKADMGAEGANESEIASSLKSKIREILNEEISKKQQATSVFTAASALTSLCDMADNASSGRPNKESEKSEDKNMEKEHEEKEEKKAQSNTRDDIPMSFPQKLMEILDDENNEHIITWLPHGKAFIIYQKKKFATEILTKYFKESKYTSFTRKLNRWGFVRVTKGPEIGAYYHKCFQRGNYLLCMQMSCQSSNKSAPRNNDKASQSQMENPLIGSMLSQANASPFPVNPMALHPQVGAAMPGALTHGQFRPTNPQQMEYLSQQIKLMNLQRQANSAGVVPNGPVSVGGNQFSNAVVAAAVDALQRSYDGHANSCGEKASLTLSHPMQQHIERFQRFGIMHPGLYSAIMQQQAAAAAMLRAQQIRQQQQNQDERARNQRRGIAKRAHAA